MLRRELRIETRRREELIPYARNARTHDEAQIEQIAASMREFGWTNPVLIDEAGGIIAGHGRVLAAERLGVPEVPAIVLAGLTESQRRAYVIADNKLALNAGWNAEMLAAELADLAGAGYELTLTGFGEDELAALLAAEDRGEGAGGGDAREDAGTYTTKIVAPTYEPKGECPEVADLLDRTKADELLREIDAAPGLAPELRRFLEAAAERHVVFNFARIADYYAHAPEAVQGLIEASALVIIDFEDAVAGGFVRLTEAMRARAEADAELGDDEGGDDAET